jgi:type II secretory ATPase GspE/PulE/Tfp pilus assembly ATPase PilB-like protein
MRRLLLVLPLVILLAGNFDLHRVLLSQAVAQESGSEDSAGADEGSSSEEAAEDAPPAHSGWSGPGFYFNVFKILAVFLLFCLWVHTTDWASRDGQEMNLDYFRWNPILFGSFMAGFVLVLVLPFFWIGYPLLLISYAVPMAFYVRYRNAKVEPHQTVMTRPHLRYWFAEHLAPFGVKIQKEEADPHTTGVPVILNAQGAPDERQNNVNLLNARQSPGFRNARQVVADALYRRADAIMLDFTQEAMGVRHLVDGVWHSAESWEREIGDPVLESFKLLCGLNPQDRRGRQEGPFAAEYLKEKYSGLLTCQGTETGERAVLKFEGKKTHFDDYDDLGMRPKMQEEIKELMGREAGFVLFSAQPASGLRSTVTVALVRTDRFMRELVSIEEEKTRYEEIENVQPILYKTSEGVTPDKILQDIFYKEPNVVIVRDLVNGETVRMMAHEVTNNRLFVGTVRAKDSCEALLRVLALQVPPPEFARAVTAVLCQRLIRKLCEECKEAYAPTPQMLAQLRIPEGRVQAFYRPRTPSEENPEICHNCSGIGYVGRTAIFELLVVSDEARKVLASNPKPDLLRQAARKGGLRSFQEEGIVLVAKGVTSLEELMRVLKQ